MSEATRRVDRIIDAAEKAADEIRADAKQESGRARRRRPTSEGPPQSAAGAKAAGGGRPLRQSMADATRRVEEVIDAAESAAAEIRAEAEAEASRLVETRRKEAAEIREAAGQHLTERRKEAAEIRAEAEAEAGRLLEARRAEATEIRAEAEAEASRYLAARRVGADRLVQARQRAISELSRSLLGHAERLREQAEALAVEVEQTVARIREVPDSGGAPGGDAAVGYPPADEESGTEPAIEPAPEPAADSEPPAPEAPPAQASRRSVRTDGVSEAALLRATQMAVGGSDRTEIDRALRKKFGLTDTDAILDEILGDEG